MSSKPKEVVEACNRGEDIDEHARGTLGKREDVEDTGPLTERKFLKGTPFLRIEEHEGGVQVLTSDNSFFGSEEEPPQMFVRKVFITLYNLILSLFIFNHVTGKDNVDAFEAKNDTGFCKHTVRQYVVTGTPGTGKSFLAIYFLYRWLHIARKRKTATHLSERDKMSTIVYRFLNNSAHVFRNGEYEGTISHESFELRYAADSAVWIIYDPPFATHPHLVQRFNASCIMFSSPEGRRYGKFVGHRLSLSLFYLPPWTLDELQQLRLSVPFFDKRLDNGTNQDREKFLNRRFEIYGGNARGLFQHIRANDSYNDILKAEMDFIRESSNQLKENEARFLDSLGLQLKPPDIIADTFQPLHLFHNLVHMQPIAEKDYQSYELVYASPLCHILVGYSNLQWVFQYSDPLLQTRLYGENCGTQPGLLFELCVHQMLIYGKRTFRIRLDGSGSVDRNLFTQTFNVSQGVRFSKQDLSDVGTITNHTYYFPNIENFATVDSFMVLPKTCIAPVYGADASGECLVVFQSTIARDHDLKVDGLMTIVNKVQAVERTTKNNAKDNAKGDAKGSANPDVNDVFVVFCVPSERFDRFRMPTVTMSGSNEVNIAFGQLTVKQAAMEIDYGSIKNGFGRPETSEEEQNKVRILDTTSSGSGSTSGSSCSSSSSSCSSHN